MSLFKKITHWAVGTSPECERVMKAVLLIMVIELFLLWVTK